MSINGKAYIVGAFEHPTRKAVDKSLAQLHAEVAKGAIEDAGLSHSDIDGFICAAGDAPGLGPINMIDYLGINPTYFDSTDTGGSSYVMHVEHAAQAIAQGRCRICLITLAGRPAAENMATGTAPRAQNSNTPDVQFEFPYAPVVTNMYGMAAMRHMHEYGTTSEQLAWIRVAASTHAQYNPHALRQEVVTVEDVVNSPMISTPLHRLDCCVISDGGGALIVAHPDVAKSLKRPLVKVRGAASRIKGQLCGDVDLTYTAARYTGPQAFEEAGLKPSDIKYASIYDSFTITVLLQLEDLGFCEKGKGGAFVSDGNLISGVGKLPFNTDGGGLCNNHPANRGGMTKVIEAVRQLRGEAHEKVQVPNCDLALAHGTGGSIGTRHGSATLIMERE
jgi:acetyl-CoA C-acetyltransferase